MDFAVNVSYRRRRLGNSSALGEQHQRHAVARRKLRHERRDVRLYRRFSDDHLGGNLGICGTARNERKDLHFAPGHQAEPLALLRAQLAAGKGGACLLYTSPSPRD